MIDCGIMPEASAPVLVLFAVLDGTSDPRPSEEHVSVLATLVGQQRGRVVKRLTDGVMAVFSAPTDGVSCALAMQCAVAEQSGRLPPLRVGLSFGEPFVEDGDYFGTPVVVSRRLCDRAERGQVLCASLIGHFESARERATFRSIGALELKGISSPVATSEVVERTPDGAAE
jgi:adenylate cyclase